MTMVWSNKLQTWRKKIDRRADSRKPRTEKQALTARHKQLRRSMAKHLGVEVTDLEWVNNKLVFAKTGEPVRLKVQPKVIASL